MRNKLQKALAKLPEAQRYLNSTYNSVKIYDTPGELTIPEINSSTTIRVFPKDGCMPEHSMVHLLMDYCFTYADVLDIEEIIIQFVLKDKDGIQQHITAINMNGGEHLIRVTASCGQKALLVYETYEDFISHYPSFYHNNYLDFALAEYQHDYRVLIRFSTELPPAGFEGTHVLEDDLINKFH